MSYYEIDFLAVETEKSGDAIPMRYEQNGVTIVHITDGGYLSTGEAVVDHVTNLYGTTHVDHVVVTHPDGDHAAGLRVVLESCTVGALWMLRPWNYAAHVIHRFSTYNSVERLQSKLKASYPNLAALEVMAIERGIPIYEPFQGSVIGNFTVMAPTVGRYLDLIVGSDKTPSAVTESASNFWGSVLRAAANVVAYVKSAWGDESFPSNDTSAENEMSVIQFAYMEGHRILLTGDAGVEGLTEAINYAPMVGLTLPGLERVQIPHHGSRRNVSTDVLDRLLGPRLSAPVTPGYAQTLAIVSSAKADPKHPRKAVKRAFIHRGADVYETEGNSIRIMGGAVPPRYGWGAVSPVAYPDEQEE